MRYMRLPKGSSRSDDCTVPLTQALDDSIDSSKLNFSEGSANNNQAYNRKLRSGNSTFVSNNRTITSNSKGLEAPNMSLTPVKTVRRVSSSFLFGIIGIIVAYLLYVIISWIICAIKNDDTFKHLQFALATSLHGFIIMINELLLLGERRKVTQVRVDGYSKLYLRLMGLLGGCHYVMVVGTFLVNITLLGDMAADENRFLKFIDDNVFIILVITICLELITMLVLILIIVRRIKHHQNHPKAPDALTYMAVFGETELPDVSTDTIICGQGEAIYRMMTHLVNIQKQLASVSGRIQMCRKRGTTPVFEGLSDDLKTIIVQKQLLENRIETDMKGTRALQTEIAHFENQIHSSIRHWEERNRRRAELIERRKSLMASITEVEGKIDKPISYTNAFISGNSQIQLQPQAQAQVQTHASMSTRLRENTGSRSSQAGTKSSNRNGLNQTFDVFGF